MARFLISKTAIDCCGGPTRLARRSGDRPTPPIPLHRVISVFLLKRRRLRQRRLRAKQPGLLMGDVA